jgi:hypothetical protein
MYETLCSLDYKLLIFKVKKENIRMKKILKFENFFYAIRSDIKL